MKNTIQEHGEGTFTVLMSMGIESGTLSGIENGTLWTGPCGGSVATGAGAGPEW